MDRDVDRSIFRLLNNSRSRARDDPNGRQLDAVWSTAEFVTFYHADGVCSGEAAGQNPTSSQAHT